MDRIKFRTYVKKLDSIFPVTEINFITETVGVDVSGNGDIVEYKFEEAVLMQCTGLKEDGGGLVFEGDILAPSIGYDDFASEVHIVTWEDGGWHLKAIQGNYIQQMEYADDMDVIGNIYKNADWLDGSMEDSNE